MPLIALGDTEEEQVWNGWVLGGDELIRGHVSSEVSQVEMSRT